MARVECGQINTNNGRKRCQEVRKEVCYKLEIKQHKIAAALWRTLVSSCLTNAEGMNRHKCNGLHVAPSLCATLFRFNSQINNGLSDCMDQTENTRAPLPGLFQS